MEILLIIAIGTLNIVCFFVGAKVGQETGRGEEIQLPKLKSPVQACREHRAKKEAEMEQDRMAAIMRNIDKYDGTSNGQEDVPGTGR